MLKIRLIPVLYIKNGLIVRSEGFSWHQNIGNVVNQAHRYNEWDVDELIYIDISRHEGYDLRRGDHKIQSYSDIDEIAQRIASVCFMPLTFGGGIRTLDDAMFRIRAGADKVTLNTAALETPELISQIATRFGSQAVVVSIDYRVVDGMPKVHSAWGQSDTHRMVTEWASECADRGAGEVLITSIERDGKANGYDINTLSQVALRVKIPVIACGGVGNFGHFVEVIRQTGVSAVAAGNIFHFTERSYPRAKQFLKRENINVR